MRASPCDLSCHRYCAPARPSIDAEQRLRDVLKVIGKPPANLCNRGQPDLLSRAWDRWAKRIVGYCARCGSIVVNRWERQTHRYVDCCCNSPRFSRTVARVRIPPSHMLNDIFSKEAACQPWFGDLSDIALGSKAILKDIQWVTMRVVRIAKRISCGKTGIEECTNPMPLWAPQKYSC